MPNAKARNVCTYKTRNRTCENCSAKACIKCDNENAKNETKIQEFCTGKQEYNDYVCSDCRVNARLNFFSNPVIAVWNSLPETVVTAPTIDIFKSLLMKLELPIV